MTALQPNEDEYLYFLRDKARRARRRMFEATREPGHLRAWFQKQGNPGPGDELGTVTFRQLMRSYKHGCHAACCVIDAYEKRHRNRVQRREIKIAPKRRAEEIR
jgi:hypothetical protein